MFVRLGWVADFVSLPRFSSSFRVPPRIEFRYTIPISDQLSYYATMLNECVKSQPRNAANAVR